MRTVHRAAPRERRRLADVGSTQVASQRTALVRGLVSIVALLAGGCDATGPVSVAGDTSDEPIGSDASGFRAPLDGIDYWEIRGEAHAAECVCHWAEWQYASEEACRHAESSSDVDIGCWEQAYVQHSRDPLVASFFSCLAMLHADLVDCLDDAACDASAAAECRARFDASEGACETSASPLYDHVVGAAEFCIGD